MTNKHIGSDFDSFLLEEGIFAHTQAVAAKRAIVFQLEKTMHEQKISKTEMSRRMRTSRAALDRLLDPTNDSVTLQTLDRAAHALGKQLEIHLA